METKSAETQAGVMFLFCFLLFEKCILSLVEGRGQTADAPCKKNKHYTLCSGKRSSVFCLLFLFYCPLFFSKSDSECTLVCPHCATKPSFCWVSGLCTAGDTRKQITNKHIPLSLHACCTKAPFLQVQWSIQQPYPPGRINLISQYAN